MGHSHACVSCVFEAVPPKQKGHYYCGRWSHIPMPAAASCFESIPWGAPIATQDVMAPRLPHQISVLIVQTCTTPGVLQEQGYYTAYGCHAKHAHAFYQHKQRAGYPAWKAHGIGFTTAKTTYYAGPGFTRVYLLSYAALLTSSCRRPPKP